MQKKTRLYFVTIVLGCLVFQSTLVPYFSMADSSSSGTGCTAAPAGYSDNDCDNRYSPTITCGTASNPCGSGQSGGFVDPYNDDVDDNDSSYGSVCDHSNHC
jgi:hypothetical protein